MNADTALIYDPTTAVDPLGDAEKLATTTVKRNRAKVGAARPSSLLYTYGPGAIMDLPQFTIMPTGLDEWDRIWSRRDEAAIPVISAPRLRRVVKKLMESEHIQLRPHPWQPTKGSMSLEGADLGVPARVFPQWFRCTGCDLLGPLTRFSYTNTHPFRTDLACFEHTQCTGRVGSRNRKATRRTAVPARYLLACVNGHLDEFPYDQWVHHWQPCPKAKIPALKMVDRTAGKGASAVIVCGSCGARRGMNEAQGEAGARKLPRCRGRHPHLDSFDPRCGRETRLILVGASNLWFPETYSIIVMPESTQDQTDNLATRIRAALDEKKLTKYAHNLDVLRDLLEEKSLDVAGIPDDRLAQAVEAALSPEESPEELKKFSEHFDSTSLLVPEWQYLQRDPRSLRDEDEVSGLTLSKRDRGSELRKEITRVLAVEKLRKVNALVGFTRIDDIDRADSQRRVKLTRADKPKWTVATEDRGEGIFLQVNEDAVRDWETRIESTDLWEKHRQAHRRNFDNRFSGTAQALDPDSRLRPPRYWLIHTLAHVLIRELAMTCGYSAASLSERLYAWPESDDRAAAAGLLICTTASDSDGTLGGLVQMSEPDRFERVVTGALHRARRCSSDPICANRTPEDPEDFLHGAACHCCVMASETSCERANRFLDRRFLVDLPGSDLGFFGTVD
ncbi:MAG TPA: DrmB family protein [Pseudonocardiaceae bacterium]